MPTTFIRVKVPKSGYRGYPGMAQRIDGLEGITVPDNDRNVVVIVEDNKGITHQEYISKTWIDVLDKAPEWYRLKYDEPHRDFLKHRLI